MNAVEENKMLREEISAINKKLDIITGQLAEQQKGQREMKELKDDLSLIAKDMFDSAVEELNDVAPYFETQDLILMVKKLLGNTKNLNRLLSQMESLDDLYQDVQPLVKQIFDEVLDTLNDFDKKGYFEFVKEAMLIVDEIVTSFSVEDVKLLRENVTSILLTVKGMTQPEMLKSVDNAVGFFNKMDITVEKTPSYFEIMKEMNNPEVKKGMMFMLQFMKNMAKPNTTENNLSITTN